MVRGLGLRMGSLASPVLRWLDSRSIRIVSMWENPKRESPNKEMPVAVERLLV